MWRTISIILASALALPTTPAATTALTPDHDRDRSITCHEPGAEPGARTADGPVSPDAELAFCQRAVALGLTEVRPGIAVTRSGATVTVLADRSLVAYRAVEGPARHASSVPGDVVVNANWFTAAGIQGPIVVDGVLAGSADTIERGQIVALDPACSSDEPGHSSELRHVWTGERYQHDPCTIAAVSGVSLVHKGLRADAYPGIDLTDGPTNVSRSHSFIGFNEREIIVIATSEMSASELADFALSLGAHEGVMLDGGRSTQISTPTESLTSSRPVPGFAVLDRRR